MGLIHQYYAGVWVSYISVIQEYMAHTWVIWWNVGLIHQYYAGVWVSYISVIQEYRAHTWGTIQKCGANSSVLCRSKSLIHQCYTGV
jgi:hypothetical protein